MGNEGDRVRTHVRRRIVAVVALGVVMMFVALMARSPSVEAYSTSITYEQITTTGGGGLVRSDCVTGSSGEVIYKLEFEGVNWSSQDVLTYAKAHCADLASGGKSLNVYRRTLGPYGDSRSYGPVGYECGYTGGTTAIVGARVYKSSGGYVAGVAGFCGTLPTGTYSNTLTNIGWTSATYEDIWCPANTVALGIYVGYGSILDKFGLRCGPVAGVAQSTLTVTSTTATFGSNLTLTTSGGSGSGAVTYSKVSGNCTVSGSTLTPTAAGSCVVSATKASDTNYSQISSANTTVTINQASNTISFTNPGTRTWSSTPFSLTVTATSGVTPVVTSSDTSVCTVSGTTLTMVASGTCSLTANEAGNSNYLAASASSLNFTINKATQSITFTDPADRAWSSTTFALSPSATSSLAVTLTSNTTGICSVSGFDVRMLASGTCSLTASQAGDGRYSAASSVTQEFVITSLARTGFTGTSSIGVNGTRYLVERFTTVGTTNWTAPKGVTSVELLVVGGGGGGGARHGGGGGAGGVATSSGFSVTPGSSYAITVGGGGPGGTAGSYYDANPGSNGSSSSFASLTANGGEGGFRDSDLTGGRSGGTGSSYLNNGGTGVRDQCPSGKYTWCGGGGGGAGAIGGNAVTSGVGSGGAGGRGVDSSITGAVQTYAGGGGGGGGAGGGQPSAPGGAGGLGGGGQGGDTNVANGSTSCTAGTAGYAGVANTGGGGGAGGYCNGAASAYMSAAGGDGGSGIVIVRYALPVVSEPVLVSGSDSGTQSDNITNFTTVTLSGTAPVGAIVQLSTIADASFVNTSSGSWTDTGSTCPASSTTGDWSCTTSVLAGGTYRVRATATTYLDGVTDTRISATALPLTIDTTAPSVSSFASAVSSPSNASSIAYTLTFDATVSGLAGGAGGDFANAGTATDCSFAVSGSGSSYTVTVSACSDGTIQPRLSMNGVSDAAGNTGPSANSAATTTIAKDTSAPTITLTAATIKSSGSASVSSTETGTAYLVRSSVSVSNLASITGAADDVWNQVSIASASTATSLAATGLIDGTYVAYAVDAAGNVSSVSGTSVTIDSTAPTVSSVSSPTGNGPWKAGSIVTIRVLLTEVVTVSGTPQLTLETGATDRTVTMTSGSGTNTLVFTYTVAAGDTSSDLDYTGTSALDPNGATIRDAAGNDSTLTLAAPGASGSLGNSNAIVIDTTAPTAPATPSLDAVSDSGSSNSDGITTDTTPSVTTTVAETGGTVTFTVTGGTTCVQSTVTSTTVGCTFGTLAAGSYSVTVTQTDVAGNTSSASSGTTVVIDVSAPTITLTAATIKSSGSASVSSTETGTAYLVRSSVSVSNLASITGAADDVWNQVSIASASTATSLAATGLIDGTYVAYAVDAAGNFSSVSGTSVTIDSTAPSVVNVTSTAVADTYGVGSTINIQVVFSETVTVSGTPRITLETGSTDRVVNLTGGSGTDTLFGTYTVVAGDTSNDLDYISTNPLVSNGATIVDGANNIAILTVPAPGTSGSLSVNEGIVIDTTAPTAPTALDLASMDDSGTSNSDDYTKKTNATFSLSVGETGGTFQVIADNGSTQRSCSASATTANVSCSVNNLSHGSWTVTATHTDYAGNRSVDSASLTVVVDTQVAKPSAPTLDSSSDTGSSSSDRITNDSTPTFSTTLGEIGGSVTFSSGALTCTQSTVTSTTVSCTYGSAISEGSNSFTVVHTDKAGNVSATSNNTTVTFDSYAPSAPAAPTLVAASDTGSSSSDRITNDSTPTFTATVSETGGSVTFTSSGGSTCTQSSVTTLTPSCTFSSLGSESVTVAHTDAAGNASSASSSTSMTLDVTLPTILMSATSPTNSPQFSVVGSEALAGVSAGDFTTNAGCTIGLTTVSASSYTVNLSACNEGPVTLTLASGSVTDVAGNATSASTAASVQVDYTAPSVSSFTSAASIVNARSFDFSMTVSESFSGLVGSDFLNVGTAGVCTFTPVTTSATTVTVSVSCPQDGTVIARLAANSVTDEAGNTGPTSTSDSTTVTISTGPTALAVTAQPSGAPSGAAFLDQPAVALRNDIGQTVTGTAAIVTATVTQVSSTGVLVGTQTASVDTSTGVATFSNLGLTGTAGTSYTITFTSTVNSTVLTPATASATVSVGAPAQLAVTTQPVGQGAGATLATPPVVEVRDSGGNFVSSASAPIEVTASGGTLGGTTTVSAQAGTATFTNLTFAGTAGANYTLTFSSTGLSAATSSTFTVTVGAATKLVLTTTAANAQYAQAFTTQPVVEVQDAGSNRVASSHTVTATLSSGVVVGTTSSSLDATGANGQVTFGGLGITALPGPYTITYSSPLLASTSQSITLNKGAQTVSFTDPIDAIYSPTPVTLSATSTSNLTVTFSSLSPSICTVTGSAVTMESSGLCRIGADQAGNDYFEPATQVVQEFTISKATPTFSWADVNKTYGDAPFAITPPTASVPGTFTYSSSDITTATVSASTLNIVAGGTTTVSATFTPTDTGKYESGGQVTMILTVARATQQPITLTSTTGTYGFGLTLAVAGGSNSGALSFQVDPGTASSCAESGGALTTLSRGTCVVTATMAADRNYLSVTTTPTTVTISARPITFTADPKSRYYGDTDPALTYQVTFGSIVNNDVFSGSIIRATGEIVGDYAITQGTLANDNYNITFNPGVFSIDRRPVSVTADVRSKNYGDADPALTYQLTSGTMAFGETLVGELTRATGENVGTYLIGRGTLTNANNPNYDVTFVGNNLTINRRPITVTATAANKKYSTADPTFAYTVTSGNLIGSDQLVGVLSRAAGENVGDYAIQAGTLTNANNPNYDITFTSSNFNIYPRPITVTAHPKTITYGDADPIFTYTIGGDGLKPGDALSGALARVAGNDVGTRVIAIGTLDNPNYAITFFGSLLTIEAKSITVTADDKRITYGDPEPTLTVSTASGALVGSDSLSGSPSRDGGVNAGSYTIRQGSVTNANNPNYNITFVNGTLTIDQAPQAPLVIQSVQQTYRVDLSLQQTGGSGDGAVTWTVTDPGTSNCSITESLLSSSGVVGSSCVVQVAKAASTNFLSATSSATVTVVPRTLSITADSPSKFFGDADPTFTYTITSGVLASGENLTGALTRAPGDTPGTYAITQGTLNNTNYQIIFTPGSLTIDRRPITVTAANDGKVAGQPEPGSLGFTVTTGNVVSGSALVGTPTRAPGELIGTYPITRGGLTNANNPNYDIAFVPGTFTITGVSQSALVLSAATSSTSPASSASILRLDSADLSVSGGSGTGAVTYAIVTEEPAGACSLVSDVSTSAATVTGVKPGTCTILATKATDGTFDEVQSNVVSITVNKRPQVISFSATSPMTYQAAPFLVTPSSDSGLSVQLSSSTSSVCSVSGFQVQLLFSGLCRLVASIAESTNFLAAAPVTVDVTVSAVLPSAPTVSALTATDDWIAVTFDAGDHGGEVITGYEYSIDAGTTWVALPAGSITSPLLISDVAPSTTYGVRLRAITSVGASSDSNEMSVTTPAPPAMQSGPGGAVVVESSVVTTTPDSTTVVTTIVSTTSAPTSSSPSSSSVTTVETTTVRQTTTNAPNSTSVTTERVTSSVVTSSGSGSNTNSSSGGTSASNSGSNSQSTSGSSSSSGSNSGPVTQSGVEPPATVEQMVPGESTMTRDGVPTPIDWAPLPDGGVVATWGDVQIQIVASSDNGSDQVLPDGTFAVEAGRTVDVEAEGLAPGTPTSVWLYSEPMLLGEAVVGSSGVLDESYLIPVGIDPGGHTLKLRLIEATGEVTEVAVGLLVLDAETAALHREGRLTDSVAELLAAPTVTRVIVNSDEGSSLVALWLVLLLVLFLAVGRMGEIRHRRRIPDFVSVVADDASWTSRLRLVRWLLPITGFVLGAWASSMTHDLPVPPAALMMLALLVLGILDPLTGVAAGFAFVTSVVVGGGIGSLDSVRALILIAAMWIAPGLLGSAVSRITSSRILLIPAVVRATVATTTFVAMVETLPAYTLVETTTNEFVTEFAWVIALVSIVRTLLDHSSVARADRDVRTPRRTLWANVGGIALLAFMVLTQQTANGWTIVSFALLAAVIVGRWVAYSRRIGSFDLVRWLAVGSSVLIVLAATGGFGSSEPDQLGDPAVDLVADADRSLGDVIVDVDSYPTVFEARVRADHRVVLSHADYDVELVVASVLATGDGVPLNGRNLQVVVGEHVEISGRGLAGGSPIETWIYSVPRRLGVAEASRSGRVDTLFDVPGDQLPGRHDLRIRLVLGNGKSALVSLPIDVVSTVPEQRF